MNNTALGAENKKERVNECRRYTVEDLFCCAYAPFFWQAIQIRYPEYATYKGNCMPYLEEQTNVKSQTDGNKE